MQRNGYVAVKYKCPVFGKWKCITDQHLSYMVSQKCLNVGDRDVSLLCHNDPCVSVDHLSAGQDEINYERVECVNRGICNDHGTYPSCLLHPRQ